MHNVLPLNAMQVFARRWQAFGWMFNKIRRADTIAYLNTRGDEVLGVARGLTADLPEVLQVVHCQLVASQVQHDVLQGAGVAIAEDEPIPARPLRIAGSIAHELRCT